MKTVIALCLLIAFYTVNANPLDILRAGVQRSKNQVQNNIQQLERLRKNVAQDTIFKVKNNWIEQMRRHNDYSNPTLDAIRNEVEAAKAEGKNAQLCYDTASSTLRNIWNIASNDAQRCVDIAESSIKSELGFIDDLSSTGRTLVAELDSIFPNCISNDIFQVQRCVAVKLGTANVAVKNLQNKANSAELTAKSASNNIVLQGNNCVFNVYSPAFSQITQVRLAATKCLEAL
ncbi:PREDICTED: uncharacterized protein LOC105459085 [Wasmannia auropunctata]|uniref:uncharacterized protein LOC105459085 n=1 Tax=Wasmannia auropunctata TaxID=64793 RepID=UPI0005EDDC5F|nr:PREDICTED: uncharacterized protein LOC105459085 [Wasmannia auropunctata]